MIASLKGYGRIARTVLAVIAILLVVGIAGSLVMSVRAAGQAREQVVSQAQTIADSSLALAFTPSDVTGPVSADRALELTDQIQAIVVDPSEFESVTLYSPEGMILYSTEQSLIGNLLAGEKGRIREALKGVPQTQDHDGAFSVMMPLRFRSGVGGPAVLELTRPDSPIASAPGPWRTNALFLFAMLVLLSVAVFGVARVLSVVTDTPERQPAQRPTPQPQPARHAPPRVSVPQPGLREEGDARRRAEERAEAAEERAALLQEQYRKTLDELQSFQRLAREPQRPDPQVEQRALRAEGQVQTLQQQIQTLTAEREDLAQELRERSTHDPDPDRERHLRDTEREAQALRAELDQARAELADLAAARGQLAEVDSLRAQLAELESTREQLSQARRQLAQEGGSAAPPDLLRELDEAHVELMRTRDAATAANGQLQTAQRELDDARLELRALRNEEQRASMLEDELRTAKAELESIRASHRADLVEREAEFEEKVRATREEFQRQLSDIETAYQGQLGQRESDLAGRITQAEATARSAAGELEAVREEAEAARAEASSREQRLLQATDEIAKQREEIAGLKQEVKERTVMVGQARKETEELRRSLVGMQADLSRADEAVSTMRLELEASQGRSEQVEQAATSAEHDRRALSERVEKLTRMLEEAAAENADLNRRLQDFEARRQLELADDPGRAEIDGLLQVTQERLAGQTEKLIAAEDRVRALETDLATTTERLELVEAEMRTHQMSEALREMREGPSEPAGDASTAAEPVLEDRRASTPFMEELSLDAKKALSRINGIAQLLKHQKGAKEQAQLLKELASYAKRLDYTVTDIAEADRLANGTVDIQARRTDLEALVQRVVEESGLGSERDLRVVAEAVTIRLDPRRTEQILSGLLRAAGERTSANKAITVRLRSADGGALLSVEDPEPSSDASLSPVVRRFAEVQGGWAKVEGTAEGGSAFKVFVPDSDVATQPMAGEDTQTPDVRIVVDEPQEGPEEEPQEETWEASSAEQILSRELRRLAELPVDER
jgi:chromosome segregation ATPase